MNEPSDEELYRHLQQGGIAALEQLYERYESAILRYALHMSGSRFIAEEVVQDVFMQLIEPRNGFDRSLGSLEAYLYGIARNRLRMIKRSRRGEPLREYANGADVLQDLIDDESLAALHRSLRALSDRYRDVVVLCDLEEKSYEDAARLLNCPVGTVRSRLHRARALLCAKLQLAARELAR